MSLCLLTHRKEQVAAHKPLYEITYEVELVLFWVVVPRSVVTGNQCFGGPQHYTAQQPPPPQKKHFSYLQRHENYKSRMTVGKK